MVRRLWALGVAVALCGCGERPRFSSGEACELNSDCTAPLVCRLDRCRVECRGLRDCPTGFLCYRDEDGLGACQLRDETECTLTSECPTGLVCLHGQCTNECVTESDCPAGTMCQPDDDGGGMGCVDLSEGDCKLHSDCPVPLVCAPDRRCRPQCVEDRDCRDGRTCIDMGGVKVCGWPAFDAGPRDGGIDAATDGGPDAGPDAGTTPPPSVGLMSAGNFHTCAVRTDDTYCWGTRFRGSPPVIAESDLTPRPMTLPGVRMIVSGAEHTCADTPAGELVCWGGNEFGELGRGGADYDATPMAVAGLAPEAVGAGRRHTCSLSGGQVWCWGLNTSGQLGDGTTTSRATPQPADLPVGVVPADVTARGQHTCALTNDGDVYCWGFNLNGQVGQDPALGSPLTPILVMGLPGPALEIDAGSNHTCARTASGLYCWGANASSQLARPPATVGESAMPLEIPGLTDPVEIEAGFEYTCARLADGTVACWGRNDDGQCGVAGMSSVPTPTTVSGLSDVVEIVAGDLHACARTMDGMQYCWGNNVAGQLGRGAAGPSDPTPVPVTFP